MTKKTWKKIAIVIGVIMIVAIIVALWFFYMLLQLRPIFQHKPFDIKEYGYYQYIIVGEYTDNPYISIVGLTETGLEQEVLDIPSEIDEKPVLYIGYDDRSHDIHYFVYSENLKKIYIHDNIRSILNCENENGSIRQIDVMICSIKNEFSIHDSSLIKNVYYYGDMKDKVNTGGTIKISSANTVFMNNYSDEVNGGYYRLDNIETDEKIPEPPAPTREGYEFTGWYTEAECTNEWDFDVSPTIEEETEFRLYAGWRNL